MVLPPPSAGRRATPDAQHGLVRRLVPRRSPRHPRPRQAAQTDARRVRRRRSARSGRTPTVRRARRLQRHVERALLVQDRRACTSSACPPRARASSRGPARTPASSTSATASPPSSRWSRTTIPSFIEPYQGAATGVGGILRDVFTMGARPIASLELAALRSARSPAHGRAPARRRRRHRRLRQLHRRAHRGRRGAVRRALRRQHPRQRLHLRRRAHRPHLLRARQRHRQPASSTSAPRPAATASTARPWPATSSAPAGPASGPRCRSAIRSWASSSSRRASSSSSMDVLEGIQDMGAAGLTSSSVEMAGRADNGIELDLDAIPRRAKRLCALRDPAQRVAGAHAPRRQARQGSAGARRSARSGSSTPPSSARSPTPGAGSSRPRRATIRSPTRPSPRAPVVVCDLPIDVLTDDAPDLRPPARADARCRRARAVDRRRSPIRRPGRELARARRLAQPRLARAGCGGSTTTSCAAAPSCAPGRDAAVVRVPCEKRRHDDREAPRLQRPTATAGMCELDAVRRRGDGGGRGVPQPRLRRRRAHRPHRLPQLRQPRAARDYGAVRTRHRRHRRRVQGARRAHRERQREPLQRDRRPQRSCPRRRSPRSGSCPAARTS